MVNVKARFRWTIATLQVVGIGLILVAVMFEISYGKAVLAINEALRTRTHADATRLAADLGATTSWKDLPAMTHAIEQFLEKDKAIRGITILDPEGKILLTKGSTFPPEVLSRLAGDEDTTVAVSEQFYSTHALVSDGGKLGRFLLMKEDDSAYALRAQQRWVIYLTLVLVLGFTTLGGYLQGRRINRPIENLSGIAGRVLSNSSDVMGATSQMASIAAEQAAAVAETNVTMEEVKQTAQSAKESAQKIVVSSERSVEFSEKGMGAVDVSTTEIKHIREQVEAIAVKVDELRGQVSEVGEIISTVNDIAEQSNLLAVNASIEAAKASEYGRGFAVVAQEVKNLALQSKQATAQVRGTLGAIQRGIEELYDSARLGRERTEIGVQSIVQTGEIIRRLSEVISDSANDAQQIAISSNEQVIGLEQATMAMNSINQTATETMTSSQQLERNGHTLHSMAMELEGLVANYRVGG